MDNKLRFFQLLQLFLRHHRVSIQNLYGLVHRFFFFPSEEKGCETEQRARDINLQEAYLDLKKKMLHTEQRACLNIMSTAHSVLK